MEDETQEIITLVAWGLAMVSDPNAGDKWSDKNDDNNANVNE